METILSAPYLNDEILAYFEKWKSQSSSFKAIDKDERKKLEEVIKTLNNLERESRYDVQFSIIAEQYLSLANNLVHLKWAKKDPKTRVDINLKCDSLFNKILTAFNVLTDLLKANINACNQELNSEILLDLNDEFQKLTILSKIFYEYSIALRNGGELEE